jgi:pimeloyl-ACP methyl ester carboxylesterase
MTRWRALNIAGAPTFVAPGATEDQIREISVPTVIVSGDDETHSPAQAERLHGLIAASELAPFQFPLNPTTEHREKLAQIFTEFIAKMESQ